MIRTLLVTVSLASAIGLFAAAKHVVEISFTEPAHECVEHAGQKEPAALAHHQAAK